MPNLPFNFSFSPNIVAQLILWLGYACLALLVFGVVFVVYLLYQYKYKVVEFPLFAGGNGNLVVGKPKKNRIAWDKKKTCWKTLYPLFNKKSHEPFSSEHIYPGDQIFAFKMGDELIPANLDLTKYTDDKGKNKVTATLKPIPYYIRNWQIVEFQKNEIEFSKNDWWTQNKQLFWAMVTILGCLLLVGATIYFTFKFADQKANSIISALSQAAQNAGANIGAPPA